MIRFVVFVNRQPKAEILESLRQRLECPREKNWPRQSTDSALSPRTGTSRASLEVGPGSSCDHAFPGEYPQKK